MEMYPIVLARKGEIVPVRENYKRKPKNLGELILYLSELKHRGINPSEMYDTSLMWATLHFGVSWDGIKKVVGLDSLSNPRGKVAKAIGDFLRGNPSSYREIDEHLKQSGFDTIFLSSYLGKRNFNRVGKLGKYIYYVKDDPDALRLVREKLEARWLERYGNFMFSISEPTPLSKIEETDRRIVSDLAKSGRLVVLPKPIVNPFFDAGIGFRKKGRHRVTEGPHYVIKTGQEQEFAKIVLDDLVGSGKFDAINRRNLIKFVKAKNFPKNIQEAIRSQLSKAEYLTSGEKEIASSLENNPSTYPEIIDYLRSKDFKTNLFGWWLTNLVRKGTIGYVGPIGDKIYYLEGNENNKAAASIRMYMSNLPQRGEEVRIQEVRTQYFSNYDSLKEKLTILLEKHPEGLMVKQIAKELGTGIQTTSKYVSRLNETGEAYVRKVGQTNLVYRNKVPADDSVWK